MTGGDSPPSRPRRAAGAVAAMFAWAFGWIARSVRYALNMNARQIRALMCWGMLLGVAVEGFTVIALLWWPPRQASAALLREVILYSEWLRIGMVMGVVLIATQANAMKARLGEFVEIDTNIHREQADDTGA